MNKLTRSAFFVKSPPRSRGRRLHGESPYQLQLFSQSLEMVLEVFIEVRGGVLS